MANIHDAPDTPDADTRSTVRINVSLPRELHRQLRIRAATDDCDLKDTVAAALQLYLSEQRPAR